MKPRKRLTPQKRLHNLIRQTKWMTTDDIEERLRSMELGFCIEAADEIKRLRTANKKLRTGSIPDTRTFKDETTYEEPAMWVDSKNQLWKGPLNPDGTVHFAKFHGFTENEQEPIWVLQSSECPDDCVIIKVNNE